MAKAENNGKLDIFDYKTRFKGTIKRLEKSDISKKNKELILEFNKACFLEGLSIARRDRYIDLLRVIALRYLKKRF